MSAIEHIRAAETLLEHELPDEPTGEELALRAQAHASLALAHLELERQVGDELAQLPQGDHDHEEDHVL